LKITNKNIKTLGFGAFAAFATYFCMYAFRKPFAVATFENLSFLGIDYKIVLIISQVMGYMISKFLGIKLISELKPKNRFIYLLGMISLAELSLVLFGLVPPPYNFVFMFLNGLPLGLVWGIVFSYLEGRKFTEIMGVVLCSSFIVSSGVVKSVGLIVMNTWSVSEFWMPAVTGAVFLIPFMLFSFLLNKIPPPTQEDKQLRKERLPMSREDRKKVIKTFFFPIVILILFYVCLTALRDFRDNFSREIWDAVGFEGNASIYTLSEIPIAVLVLILIGLFGFLKDNYKAFISYHMLLIIGVLFIGISTFLFQLEAVSAPFWMISIGFGLYICYVPFNCIFFDRMIATFRINGNAGYLIYLSDAFGYLGSMGVLLYKNFWQSNLSWLKFMVNSCYVIAVLGLVISVVSLLFFKNKYRKEYYNFHNQIPITSL